MIKVTKISLLLFKRKEDDLHFFFKKFYVDFKRKMLSILNSVTQANNLESSSIIYFKDRRIPIKKRVLT